MEELYQDSKTLEALYQVCVKLVRSCIHEKIERERIERIVTLVADAFQADPYNELLLLFYRDTKENFIYAHIANSMILSIAFSTSIGLSRQDIMDIGCCAFGHDFGMIDYMELFQKPEQLTDEHKLSIQKHPIKSAELFKPHFSERVINGMLDVHECVNGTGYPMGKTSAAISFLGKIVSICDIFEALTHPRNFRSAFSPYAAIKMIIKKKDVMFEKKILKEFVEFMSIYPIGCIVRINSGETGMVVASNPKYPTRPIVHILLDSKRDARTSGKVINLLNDPMLYISEAVDENKEKEK